MLIYFILYSSIGFTALFAKNLKADYVKKRFFLCMVSFVLLVMLFSLRHPSMGVDLQYGEPNGYLGQFQRISRLSFTELFSTSILNYEIGFVIFNKLISYISTDVQFYLFACTFFAILPIFYIIYKYSETPVFSFIIYLGLPVFLMLFSGMRQILAIGLCAFAIKFILGKKPIKFIITVVVATLFHYSAIVFFIAYPIFYIKLDKKMRILSLLLIALTFIFRKQLFVVLSKILKPEASITDNGAFSLFAVFVIVYVYCFVFAKNDKIINGLLNIFLFACLAQAFGGIYSTAMRVGYYFMLNLVLLLPRVVKNIEDFKIKFLSYLFISVAFIAFGLWSLYNSSWAMAYPYYFFWGPIL